MLARRTVALAANAFEESGIQHASGVVARSRIAHRAKSNFLRDEFRARILIEGDSTQGGVL